jgi:hypothetical protein
MSERCWIAMVDDAPAGATAAARLTDADGAPAGWLAAWRQRAKPVRQALRADPRIVDPAGAPAWISLVLAPPGFALPFDDLAVQQARRDVLARRPARAVSTLLRDSSHFEGAITAADEPVGDDPFARLFPARSLRAGPGLIAAAAPPVGPAIERYGSANPWPWDRFGPT